MSSEEYNSVMQFGGGCYIPLMEMTQRLTTTCRLRRIRAFAQIGTCFKANVGCESYN
ncbi:MAG: hypothetical protein ACTSQ8_22190 [Candidatus Helarchaeota archaeon]